MAEAEKSISFIFLLINKYKVEKKLDVVSFRQKPFYLEKNKKIGFRVRTLKMLKVET